MDRPVPPVAKRVPLQHERFGLTWADDYAWLRDPAYPKVEDPEILGYLRGRERLFRPRDGAPRAARRDAPRRAQGTPQAGRQLGAGARRRLRVSLAVHARRSVPDLASPGLVGARPVRDPRRDTARRRTAASSISERSCPAPTARFWPTRSTRTDRSATGSPSRTSRPASSSSIGSRTRPEPSPGARTAARSSMSSGARACVRSGSAPIVWAPIRPRTGSCTRRPTRPSSSRSAGRVTGASF